MGDLPRRPWGVDWDNEDQKGLASSRVTWYSPHSRSMPSPPNLNTPRSAMLLEGGSRKLAGEEGGGGGWGGGGKQQCIT